MNIPMGGKAGMHALTRATRVAPRVGVSVAALRTSPWAMLALVLAVAFAIHVVLPAYLSTTVLNPMGAVIGVAAVGGIRRSADRTAFSLLAGGVVVYAVADLVAFASPAPNLHAFATGLFIAAYIAFAGGLAHHLAGSNRE